MGHKLPRGKLIIIYLDCLVNKMYHNSYSILIPNGYCQFCFHFCHCHPLGIIIIIIIIIIHQNVIRRLFFSSRSLFVFMILFSLVWVLSFLYIHLFMVEPEGMFHSTVYFANCVSHFDIDCQLMKIMD